MVMLFTCFCTHALHFWFCYSPFFARQYISDYVLFIYHSMETITLGDKRIGIKTSVLEEKATACNMLCCYADELKEGFFPWIDQVRDIDHYLNAFA